ncbi:MAG: sulfite exporter TauE/SafE family protein, partial [bacterium]|nr:sulfite exporter TauE/SafE family protein [bacterium]
GLLFLFLILSIWNERLKHPVFISVLIFLLAITSVMALVGAFLLGLIFIFDLIKTGEIKKIIPSALIFLFTACLVLLQLNGASHYQEKEIFILFLGRIKTFLFWGFNGGITGILNQFISFVSVCFYVFFLAAAIKKPKALFFFILSNLFLVCIFTFKYLGNWWHYLFFYVYAIVSVWLLRLENIKFKNIFFISLIFLMSLKTVLFKFDNIPFLFDSKTDKIVEIIKEKELLKKDYKLYSLESDSNTAIGILPYFDGLKNYDVFGRERYTNKEFKAILYDYRTEIDPDILSKTFEFDKKNIAITDFKRKTKYYGKSFDLLLIPVYENKNPYFALYEMRLYKK